MDAAPSSRRRPSVPVHDARQIDALGTPARQEIVDGLHGLGPCSIAELAASLGRAPDSLYYHVRKLERVGLVVRAGTRRTGIRDEVLYDTPGRLYLDHEPSGARERAALLRLVRSAVRLAERELRAALESGRAIVRRVARRNTWGARVKGWLTRAELAEVREHLAAVTEICAHARRRRGTGLHSVTFVLAPLEPNARGTRRNAAESNR